MLPPTCECVWTVSVPRAMKVLSGAEDQRRGVT